jgi:hypothetical protein
MLLQSSATNIPIRKSSITDNPTQWSPAANNLLLQFPTTNSPQLQSSYEAAARIERENMESSEKDDLQTSSQILAYAAWGYGRPVWGWGGWGYHPPVWGYVRPRWVYGRPAWWYGRFKPYW